MPSAITGSVDDALRLGCAAIGFTIYPGSDDCFGMIEEIRELRANVAVMAQRLNQVLEWIQNQHPGMPR